MKRVIQEDSTGCGLACIAMSVGTRYKTIKKQAHELLHDWPSGSRSVYTEATHLTTFLKTYIIEYGNYRWTENWLQIKADLAIAAINLQKTITGTGLYSSSRPTKPTFLTHAPNKKSAEILGVPNSTPICLSDSLNTSAY